MTLGQFGHIIGRRVVVEHARNGRSWRCYYPNVVYLDYLSDSMAITIAGAGPNQEQARKDLAEKIRGKFARTYDAYGPLEVFPIPSSISA